MWLSIANADLLIYSPAKENIEQSFYDGLEIEILYFITGQRKMYSHIYKIIIISFQIYLSKKLIIETNKEHCKFNKSHNMFTRIYR